jgi:hypothetical protein
VIGSFVFALMVALVLLYMWGVVLEGTDAGPGVTGGVAITAGVAVLGLALYVVGRPMTPAGIVISIVAGVLVGVVAGHLLGDWVAGFHIRCSDGVRSLCGAPWLENGVIRRGELPLRYAPFGAGVGGAAACLFVGLLAVAQRRAGS